jgi:transcriptional regulator GlxA family with amidase domain
MPFTSLSTLKLEAPLRILLINAGGPFSVTLAGLAHPLRLAAKILGPQRLLVEVVEADAALAAAPERQRERWHIALLVADEEAAAVQLDQCRQLIERSAQAQFWGAVGSPVLWLARAGVMDGLRVALPWTLYPDAHDIGARVILTPNLFEMDGNRLTCCGGAVSIDFALTLLQACYGTPLQSQVKELLCVDRIRGHAERQRFALQARFGALQPKLSEAVMLMEANIEEPLTTDDVANLVGISRRQLERLFKQYLGSVPSRYYLELRLQRARQLLMDSSHSIVQVGLICGFSSGSHFSTAFSALFGISPREERQRKLLL